jgi:Na+-translocating ferredoxin:NAD+ oxidoreductase subunit G
MTNSEPQKRDYLRQAWLVILLAFAYGGALAGVHTTLGPRIEANKLQETLDVIPQLVPGADQSRTESLSIATVDGRVERVYRTRDTEGKTNGWVLAAAGQGFADKIEILIGLDETCTVITGLYVLDQKETPGLGDYIRQPAFQDRFRDKPTTVPLTIVKSDPTADYEIEALSGATVSSWSVCTIVNQAIARLREPILRELPNQEATGTSPMAKSASPGAAG